MSGEGDGGVRKNEKKKTTSPAYKWNVGWMRNALTAPMRQLEKSLQLPVQKEGIKTGGLFQFVQQ